MTTYVAAVDPTATAAGDTAWLLASAALVLLMAPGLAIFYGGMVRSKSVLNMMMMVLRRAGRRDRRVGADRLLDRVRRRRHARSVRRPDAVPRARRPGRGRPRGADPDHPVRALPGTLRGDHGRTDRRRDRRPHQVRDLAGLLRRLDGPRLCARRALDLRLQRGRARRRLDGQRARRAGLRRRHRGGDQLRRGRARGRAGARQADRLRPRADEAAQPDPGHDRRRPALVRLVRLQRRLGARRQPSRRHRASSTRCSPAAPACWPGSRSSGSATASRRRSVPPPVWSAAWSRSRRPVAR